MSRADLNNEVSGPDDDDDHEPAAAQKKISSTDYLEDTYGSPITAEDRRALYSHAHLIWTSFASTGVPPAGYKQANMQYITRYREEMEKEFPILQLCSRHWKSDHVWILNYPSWLRNWEIKVKRGKEKLVKSEEIVPIYPQNPSRSGSAKRT
jgi:hypothetical protein